MLIRFTKMHGLGNDFVVIDCITQKIRLSKSRIKKIADRKLGVGCDQVLLVESPTRPDADFRYRIYNADGSEVEQCGNGARCFARFVRDKKLIFKNTIKVETMHRILTLDILDNTLVRVDMGQAAFGAQTVHYTGDTSQQSSHELMSFSSDTLVSMGNPHAVNFVADLEQYDVETLGEKVATHRSFGEGVNASFAEVQSQHSISLRVYERGAGETQACGTGACAAAVSAIQLGHCTSPVNVHLPGGTLEVEWAGQDSHVIMTGEAVTVFHGQFRI